MKLVHGLVGVVLGAVMLSLGLWLLCQAFDLQCPFMSYVLQEPVEQGILGLALVIFVFIYALSALPAGREEQYLTFENEEGAVSISVPAINDFLGRLGDEFSGVVELQAGLTPGEKTQEVRLDISVKAGAKVQELSQALRQRVRESLRETFGITDVAAVHVFVRSIVDADSQATDEPPAYRPDGQGG